MIKVEWCPEENCQGLKCPRYLEQSHRWPRTIGTMIKVPFEARGVHAIVRRQAMEVIYLSGASDGNGGPVHLTPSEATYEVHPLGVQHADGDGVPHAVMYAGDVDPIEAAMSEPVLETPGDVPLDFRVLKDSTPWLTRRQELGSLFMSEVLS